VPEAGRRWAPPALPQKEGEAAPAALNAAGMQRTREAFAASARPAIRLGVDGIEIHGAHGYLRHEFLSPIANQRTDRYGGSLENRIRFPLEVFDVVRGEVPADKPVGVKVSAADWIQGGWDVEQTSHSFGN
jgi:2,4-dienoyl-CoA reductase-like NADH-dependent reductase (Old Yellow Enzyme family)